MTEILHQIISSRNLGSLSQITEIVKKLESNSYSYNELQKFCRNENFDFSEGFPGIMLVLEYIGYIKVNNNKSEKIITKEAIYDDIEKKIILKIFHKLSKENILHEIIDPNHLKDMHGGTEITFINPYYSIIGGLLQELGLILKKGHDRAYIVNDKYKKFFDDELIPKIENSDINKHRSELARQANERNLSEKGFTAEEYILKYEKRIRRLHKSYGKIKIVSIDDSGCGYDIKSYLNDNSKALTKLIEVKSYTSKKDSKPYFHWSYKEIEIAKKNSETYFLYLVDRTKIEDNDYEPLIVPNPARNILNNSEWNKNPDGSLLIKQK